MKSITVIIAFLIISCSASKVLVKDGDTFLNTLKSQTKKEKCSFVYNQDTSLIGKRLDFLDYENDTVYLIQEYNIQTGEFYVSIWSDKSQVEYKKNGQKVQFTEDLIFPKYYYSLIRGWDIEKIKKYENQYGDNFGANPVKAYKIRIDKGKLEVNCISFSSFFSPDLEN